MNDTLTMKSALSYDPSSGIITWNRREPSSFEDGLRMTKEHKCAVWNSRFENKEAGYIDQNGYVKIELNHKAYYGHRIAYFLMNGEMPPDEIDHIDGNRSNNAYANLRPATRCENARNVTKRTDTSSEYKGVSLFKRNGKWKAQIRANGVNCCLGHFETEADAHSAYASAARIHHGQFARVN